MEEEYLQSALFDKEQLIEAGYKPSVLFAHVQCIREIVLDMASEYGPNNPILEEDSDTWRNSLLSSYIWLEKHQEVPLEEVPQRMYEDYLILDTIDQLSSENWMLKKIKIDFHEYGDYFKEMLREPVINFVHGTQKRIKEEPLEQTRTISSTAVVSSFIRYFKGEATRQDLSMIVIHLGIYIFPYTTKKLLPEKRDMVEI